MSVSSHAQRDWDAEGSPLVPFKDVHSWLKSGHNDTYRRMQVVYLIVHLPTQAIYVGIHPMAAKAYRMWFYRLTSMTYANAGLSVAFRAVYTKREDFAFRILKGALPIRPTPTSAYVMKWDKSEVQRVAEQIYEKFGRNKLLNVTKSADDRIFWEAQVPEEEKKVRFIYPKMEASQLKAMRQKKSLTPGMLKAAPPPSERPEPFYGTTDLPAFVQEIISTSVAEAKDHKLPPVVPGKTIPRETWQHMKHTQAIERARERAAKMYPAAAAEQRARQAEVAPPAPDDEEARARLAAILSDDGGG